MAHLATVLLYGGEQDGPAGATARSHSGTEDEGGRDGAAETAGR